MDALLAGRLDAVSWFSEGSYLSEMIFAADPAPPTPPPPPTREVTKVKPGIVERGEIPWSRLRGDGKPRPQAPEEPRAWGASLKLAHGASP